MILELLITLIVVALVGVLQIGLLAPVESLAWWAGATDDPIGAAAETESTGRFRPVVVYLSVGSISGRTPAEEAVSRPPGAADPRRGGGARRLSVFGGVGLTGARVFTGFWQMLDGMRLHGDALLAV
jgi:hypothetical protein